MRHLALLTLFLPYGDILKHPHFFNMQCNCCMHNILQRLHCFYECKLPTKQGKHPKLKHAICHLINCTPVEGLGTMN